MKAQIWFISMQLKNTFENTNIFTPTVFHKNFMNPKRFRDTPFP